MPNKLMPKKLLIIAALALSACGGGSDDAKDSTPGQDQTTDVDRTNDPSDTDADDADNSTDTNDSDDGKKPIGESFIATSDRGSLELTLTEFGPGQPAEEHVGLLPDGEDLYVAHFTVKNVGDDEMDASIYDNYVMDANDEMVHEKIINLDGCQSFNDWSPTLQPGESVEGCVAFALTPDYEPIELLATGFGDDGIPVWIL